MAPPGDPSPHPAPEPLDGIVLALDHAGLASKNISIDGEAELEDVVSELCAGVGAITQLPAHLVPEIVDVVDPAASAGTAAASGGAPTMSVRATAKLVHRVLRDRSRLPRLVPAGVALCGSMNFPLVPLLVAKRRGGDVTGSGGGGLATHSSATAGGGSARSGAHRRASGGDAKGGEGGWEEEPTASGARRPRRALADVATLATFYDALSGAGLAYWLRKQHTKANGE